MKQEKSDYMNQLVYVSILMPIILIMSIVIYNNLSENIDRTGWSSEANNTIDKINTEILDIQKLILIPPFGFIMLITFVYIFFHIKIIK